MHPKGFRLATFFSVGDGSYIAGFYIVTEDRGPLVKVGSEPFANWVETISAMKFWNSL